MNRPARQRKHLIEKLASKESRSTGKRKAGKRAKRWRKWIETYKPIAE